MFMSKNRAVVPNTPTEKKIVNAPAVFAARSRTTVKGLNISDGESMKTPLCEDDVVQSPRGGRAFSIIVNTRGNFYEGNKLFL